MRNLSSTASASLTALGCLVLTACLPPRSAEPVTSSNLTAGMVRTLVTTGVTTQAEILEAFGAPNIVTMNGQEDEVWNYNRMSFESTEAESGALAILWRGWGVGGAGARQAASSSTTRSFDLILIFDENDVVKDYKLISAAF